VIAGVIVGSVADRVRAHRDLTHARRERDDRDLPLSAAAVGPLVNGDVDRFAALSAMLAIVAGAVLVISGFLRLGGVMDLVSKPVMTGFLFGLGMFVALSQLPRIFGVPAGSGNFFPRLWDLLTLPGLIIAAGLSFILLIQRLSRPPVGRLARDPASGAWGTPSATLTGSPRPRSWSCGPTARSSTRTPST
jgi:MFS superfamily sulfate permease-like transporter